MPKSAACKGFTVCFVLLLLAGGGVLAWYFLTKDDDGTGSEKGSIFDFDWPFGDNNETAAPALTNTVPPTAILSPAPTSAPSAMPTAYEYPFHQCNANATSCCNGLENLCGWPVNEILFGGVHNAQATEDKFVVPNQLRPVSEALEAGYRAINVDFCNCQGILKLCHGYCGLGEADPFEILGDLATFLEKNENEVVIVTMELNSNAGEPFSLNDVYNGVFKQIDGLTELLYIHDNPNDPWPTLGTLIENQQRLIVFHYNGPNCSVEGDCPDGMHLYFQYVQETNFEFPTVQAILDSETSCAVSRGQTSTGAFLGVNNFVTTNAILDVDNQLVAASTTNSLDFAKQRIQNCAKVAQEGNYQGKGVNLLYVDFWSQGDIVQVVQEYNRDLGEALADPGVSV